MHKKYSHICLMNWMNNISLVYTYITIKRMVYPSYNSCVNLFNHFRFISIATARPCTCRSMYCNYTYLCNLNILILKKWFEKCIFIHLCREVVICILSNNEPLKLLFRKTTCEGSVSSFFALKLVTRGNG